MTNNPSMFDTTNTHGYISPPEDEGTAAYGIKYPDNSAITLPIVVTAPHGGRFIPSEDSEKFQQSKSVVLKRGDPYTDWIAHDAHKMGMTFIFSKVAPNYINIARARTSLNPEYVRGGLPSLPHKLDQFSQEPCTDSLIPRFTKTGKLYREGFEPDEAEIKKRILRFYDPFHNALEEAVQRAKQEHGFAIVIDIHSFPNLQLPGVQPDIIAGTLNGRSCRRKLKNATLAPFRKASSRRDRLQVFENFVYQGGFITQHYARTSKLGTQSIQIELSRAAMGVNEDTLKIDDHEKYTAMRTRLMAGLEGAACYARRTIR